MADIIANSSNGVILNSFTPTNTGEFLRADSLLWKEIFLQADERDFLTFSEANGLWTVAEDNVIRWHEEGWITNNITVASFTGGATPGAVAVITIADPYQKTGTRSPFSANMTVKLGTTDLFIRLKDESVDFAHTITVQPIGNSSTATLNTVIAAGKTIIPIAHQYGERKSYNEGMMNIPVLFDENMGIVKNKITLSGTAATLRLKQRASYSGAMYQPDEDDMKTFILHKEEISFQALLGAGGTATDSDGDIVTISKGVERQIFERGNDYLYNTTVTIEDMYNWTKILIRERAGNEHDMKMGNNAHADVEKLVTDVMKNGARIYLDNLNGSTSKKIRMVDFGYNGFFLNGFMFYTKQAVEFNHPKITAAPGQPYPWYIMITPVAMTKDPVTGKAGYTVQLGYKSAPGPHGNNFDRKFQFGMGGDSSPGKGSEVDEINYRYLTEFGVAVALANQAIIARRSNI